MCIRDSLPAQCQSPLFQVIPRCYFANGRAVNQRRLDIRGGISFKLRVWDQREEAVVSGGSGMGLQLSLIHISWG